VDNSKEKNAMHILAGTARATPGRGDWPALAALWVDTAMRGKRPSCQILLVEDNPADVELLHLVVVAAALPWQISAVPNGVEALAFLRRQAPYETAPRPQLILLDLHLPQKPGLEVLAELKADAQLCQIPVLIFTSSTAPQDIQRAYSLHTNCYIPKPIDLEQFTRVVRGMAEFWGTVAVVP
jgi:CheY-like chemotaxis protein